MTESALRKALELNEIPYELAEGEGAFYGPKIDLHMEDALGRKWQMGTIQLDSQMPSRFGLTYVGPDNAEHPLYVVHRALYGSFERFIGILIEHYGGAFPVWLAPVQVRGRPGGRDPPRRRGRGRGTSCARPACESRSTSATRRSASESATPRSRRFRTSSSTATASRVRRWPSASEAGRSRRRASMNSATNCLLRCPPGKQERIVPHLPSYRAPARFNRPGDEVRRPLLPAAVLSSSREEQASLVKRL